MNYKGFEAKLLEMEYIVKGDTDMTYLPNCISVTFPLNKRTWFSEWVDEIENDLEGLHI